MNQLTCPKCGNQNAPEMSFCSNCGQPLGARPGDNAPNYNAADPPPTMLYYQPDISMQNPNPAPPPPPNFQPQSVSPPPPSNPFGNPPPPPPTKKSNKGILFGLLGCGGLLLVSLLGLIVGIPVLQHAEVLPKPLFGGSSLPPDSNTNVSNTNVSNANSAVVNSNSGRPQTGGSSLLSEMQALKQVGSFKQTEVKVIDPKDYFPQAIEAVQATYSNDSQIVVSTTGKFSSNEAAKSNYDNQITNIKNGGGTIYSNQSKNQTEAGVYKYKDYYFIEACGQGVCSRNNSSDLEALRSFATSFSAAISNSSKQNQSRAGEMDVTGTWTGTFEAKPATLNITGQNGNKFSGTLSQEGFIVEFEGTLYPNDRSVLIKETRVRKVPKDGSWALGTNTGFVAAGGNSMSGKGSASNNPSYEWSFTKQ